MSDDSETLIRTKERALTRNEYARISLKYSYKNRSFRLIVLLVVILLVNGVIRGRSTVWFTSLILVVVLLLPVWNARFLSTPRTNPSAFSAMHHEIGPEEIVTYFGNGNIHQNKLDAFLRIIRTPEGFWLYHSALNYLFLPLDIFDSERDIGSFEALLAKKGVKIVHKG